MLGNKEVMAKNISRLMKKNNIDRKKLSTDLDIKYTTLSDWINAKTYPRIDKIELLAKYFNVNKSDLVENNDKQPDAIVNSPVLMFKDQESFNNLSKEEREYLINVLTEQGDFMIEQFRKNKK